MARFSTIRALISKEFASFFHDWVLVAFSLYAFSVAIYAQAYGLSHELHRAAIAAVDEDRSLLSGHILAAFLPPHFQKPVLIGLDEIDPAMNSARFTFILDIPSGFEADARAGRRPVVQVLVDATAMMQAGIGAGYIQTIILDESQRFLGRDEAATDRPAIDLQLRFAFNQDIQTPRFSGMMTLIDHITMLSILLAGAALVREREHGTIEHLLVMPVRPIEIMLAKVLANSAVILLLTAISLKVVIEGVLAVPLAGSPILFLAAVAIYLFFTTALGMFLGTVAQSMPQLGLLFILVILPMTLLSGGQTPRESMPEILQQVTLLSPSTHFVAIAQAILHRGAGLEVIWPNLAATAAVGAGFFWVSLRRFRHHLSSYS
ncbi:ABC transporter permease [Magnetospirillum sp. 15-1]|uniref:ABC transporter permease n=1 Tax=Magnetospirillum sp. 15-1 TaxID=1979370 RepID=UPI000BBCA978|nr:ABC transporter permease [Magnetospirillum sp. 15-1]